MTRSPAVGEPVDTSARLLERSEQIARLRVRIEAAANAQGSLCVIAGTAGIGKTALLGACHELAASTGLRALRARAGQLERDLSWSVVRQLFAGVIAAPAGERAELMSGAAALAAPALGLRTGADGGALHGLYWLTVALAAQGPLVLSVDDAQWADLPSLRYLAYIGERVHELPVCLVITVRSGELESEPLAELAGQPAADVIEPRELSSEASAELVRAALGPDATSEFCLACHTATRGNPFLLRELSSQLARDGVEPSASRAAEVAGTTPASVRRAVVTRLARLPSGATELATAVALLGDDVELGEAARLARLDQSRGAKAADALTAAGILSPQGRLTFVHPLLRDAVYGALPRHERAHRHGRAARLLADGGASRQRVAAQLLASAPAGDPWVVERLRDAAAQALADGAPSTASDLLERALREPPADGERPALLAELGRAELAAGRPVAVERLHEAAEVSVQPRSRAAALLDLGRALYLCGKPRDAAAALDRGLRELHVAGADDPSLVAELQATWLGVARTEVPLRARASELLREISARPPRGENHGERALLAQAAGQLTFDGEPRERALELAHVAIADGELLRQETSDGSAWVAAMGALGWGGDFDAYERLQETAIEDARRRGSVMGFATASYGFSFSRYYRGMLRDAIADVGQAIAAERDGWRQFLPAARAQLAWALIERGELDAAATALRLARLDASWEQSSMQALVLEAQARIHLARGEHQRALEAALEAGRIAEQALIANPSIVPWRSRAAVAAARLGRLDQAQELVDEAIVLARRFAAPRPIGMALIAAGLVRGRAGVDALEEAVQVLAHSPARLEHARALVTLGAALRRNGKLKAARATLAAGLEASIACEATVLEARARNELAAAGARPRRRRLHGLESLTPAEHRVASLAAGQMSNREIAETLFISLRTVETHLTHAYQKLDIASRGQLAKALKNGDSA